MGLGVIRKNIKSISEAFPRNQTKEKSKENGRHQNLQIGCPLSQKLKNPKLESKNGKYA